MAYGTIAAIKNANRLAGHHWFDADTMRFFSTRIETGVINIGRESYFIASNRFEHPSDPAQDGTRFCLILHADREGRVHSVGKDATDGGYPSISAATAALAEAIQQDDYCSRRDG